MANSPVTVIQNENFKAQPCEYGITGRAVFHKPSSIAVEVVNIGREKIIINKMEATFQDGKIETNPPQLAKLDTGSIVLRPIQLQQRGDIDYAEGINTIFYELPIQLVLIDTLGTRYPVEDLEKAITELNDYPLSPKRLADGLRNTVLPDNLAPKPSGGPTAKAEMIAKAAVAIRTAYLPITNLYEDCTVLIEDNNMEKLLARQTQFQGYVDTFWNVFESNNVYLSTEIENVIRVTVNTCVHYVRLRDRLQKLRDSKPSTIHGQESDHRMCMDIEKTERELMVLRPKVDAHFKRLIAGQ